MTDAALVGGVLIACLAGIALIMTVWAVLLLIDKIHDRRISTTEEK